MGVWTATSLVVASMVGTGVFTTTGLLVSDIPSAPGILACWAVGGVASLCGALAYAELGAAFPESGGEYQFLSRLMHPAVGFLSAWASLIVGFAAPLAALALAFGSYLAVFVDLPPRLSAAALVVVISALNVWRVSAGARVGNALTAGKVLLVLAFVVAGLVRGDMSRLADDRGHALGATLVSPGFAVGLLWVSFAYTGWNAAAYVAGEVALPERTLPRALGIGTLAVTVLYLALNATFLGAAPLSVLDGKVEVGHVAAMELLGERGGHWLTAVIALGLVSTVGALVVTGPRIYEAVGRDMPRFRWLAARSERGGPLASTLLQSLLALAMLASMRFEELLLYVGFTLSIFAGLTVSSVFLLRMRGLSSSFRMPGYPVTPALFVALMAWMVLHGIVERPVTALVGLGTVALGFVVYLWSGGASGATPPPPTDRGSSR